MKTKMSWWKAAIFALPIALHAVQAEAAEKIPENIYEWVQSTARQSYYFNKEQIHFGVDKDGYVDFHTVVVPTLHIFDPVQIQDVVAKRRWRMQSTRGFDDLVGAAQYLKINFADETVHITEYDYLDSMWGVLDKTTSSEAVSFKDHSPKDVDYIFYQAIKDFSMAHELLMAERTQGKIRPEDQARLEKKKEDIEAKKNPQKQKEETGKKAKATKKQEKPKEDGKDSKVSKIQEQAKALKAAMEKKKVQLPKADEK